AYASQTPPVAYTPPGVYTPQMPPGVYTPPGVYAPPLTQRKPRSGMRGLAVTSIGILALVSIIGTLLVTGVLPPKAGKSPSQSQGGSGTVGPSTTPTLAPVTGGTVIDGITQEPNSLLPQRSTAAFALLVQAAIRTPLLSTDNTGGIVPNLAQEVPTTANSGLSQDGLTYTFHIKSSTKWSDGQPVTADDVLYTINLFRDPAYSAQDGFIQAASEIRNVTKTDANTIMITLKKVDAAFLALYFTDVLAFAPLPKHVYGSMAPASLIKSSESFQPTVTNGPFKLSSRVQG